MFRVITQYDESGKPPVIEKSPWHSSREIAQYWADLLKKLGYIVHIESQNPEDTNNTKSNKLSDDDLAAALAQMA